MSPSCLGRGQTLVQPLWPLSATLEIVGSVRWFGTDGVSGAALLYSSFSGAFSEDSPGWSGLPAHHALLGLDRQGKAPGGAASTITARRAGKMAMRASGAIIFDCAGAIIFW